MGNDRWTPPLINIYMWMMRLNSASPVCTGALATRVAAQCTGHYFIWDLMSAEFIRGSRFPVDGRILLQQMDSLYCIFAEKHAVYVTCLWRHLEFKLRETDLIFNDWKLNSRFPGICVVTCCGKIPHAARTVFCSIAFQQNWISLYCGCTWGDGFRL